MHRAECCQPTPSRVTRAAYLILGRGGLWGGWRWDVRFRRFYFRFRFRFRCRFRFRRSLWVGRRGEARDPPATHPESHGPHGL